MKHLILVLLLGVAPALADKPPAGDPHPLEGTYARTTTFCFFGCVETTTRWKIDADGNLSGSEAIQESGGFFGRRTTTIRRQFVGVVDDEGRLLGTQTTKRKGDTSTTEFNAWLALDDDGNLVVMPDAGGSFTLIRKR